jgi:hypothetical protein
VGRNEDGNRQDTKNTKVRQVIMGGEDSEMYGHKDTGVEKSIERAAAEQSIKRLLEEVKENEDRIVIEENDNPAAVVVPIGVYWQWLRSRDLYAQKLREEAEAEELSDEEAEANELIAEAVWWVRR